MNNINQVTEKTTGQKNFWSRLVYPVALFSLLNLTNIHDIQAQSKEVNNTINTELSVEELVSQLDKKLWVTLPVGYDSKVRNFVQNSYVMSSNNARVFTQNFILNEMKKDWWISKQNQLLFIRYAIYLHIEQKDLYDWDDWNEKRLEEFEIALDFIENCGEHYINELNIYIKKCTEEARQRTEEARQHTEEARQRTEETRQRTEETKQRTEETIRQTMSLDSVGLKTLVEIYELYKKNPSSVKPEEIAKLRKEAPKIISDCKKYGIDYKKLLPAEVRRFYGIE